MYSQLRYINWNKGDQWFEKTADILLYNKNLFLSLQPLITIMYN